jgi:hypothetical protein
MELKAASVVKESIWVARRTFEIFWLTKKRRDTSSRLAR